MARSKQVLPQPESPVTTAEQRASRAAFTRWRAWLRASVSNMSEASISLLKAGRVRSYVDSSLFIVGLTLMNSEPGGASQDQFGDIEAGFGFGTRRPCLQRSGPAAVSVFDGADGTQW